MKATKRITVRLTPEQYEFITQEGSASQNIKGMIDILMNHGDKLIIE